MSESNETFQEFPHNQPASSQADTVLSRTDITIVESAWVGPLPPPEILRRLEDIIPGAAERILRMSELQEQHQHRMEETVINIQRAAIVGDSKRSNVGLCLGFVIAALGLASGTYLALEGHEWPGVVITGMPLTGLAGVFVYGSKARRDERMQYAAQDPAAQSDGGA